MASVTTNLLNNESAIYVSIHVGGHIYESAQRTVRSKQQLIEFDSDFSIPILDEFLVAKPVNQSSEIVTPEADKVKVMPISIRMNRKGLIDSEVVAVGKMLIPVRADIMDNIQVGLLTSEENTEIALATISVQVHTVDTTTPLTRLIMELESQMTQYASTDRPQLDSVLATFQVFLTTSVTLSSIWSLFRSIIIWESYARSILFLITTVAIPYGFYIATTVTFFVALLPSKPVPFLQYFRVDQSASEDSILETNLQFLSDLMSLSRSIANWIDRTRCEILFMLTVIVTVIPSPIQVIFISAMLTNTFWFQALLNVFIRRRHYTSISGSGSPTTAASPNSFTVYEHQRWWLAKWSDKLLDDNTVPWFDPTNPSDNCPRESFTLPPNCKWDGPWRVETGSMTDTDGWQYAQDFSQKFWTSKRQTIKDFVRRRKWIRKFE